jgi:hypothetical protein
MLENFGFPQLKEDKVGIFQKDGAHPNYGKAVCDALND